MEKNRARPSPGIQRLYPRHFWLSGLSTELLRLGMHKHVHAASLALCLELVPVIWPVIFYFLKKYYLTARNLENSFLEIFKEKKFWIQRGTLGSYLTVYLTSAICHMTEILNDRSSNNSTYATLYSFNNNRRKLEFPGFPLCHCLNTDRYRIVLVQRLPNLGDNLGPVPNCNT